MNFKKYNDITGWSVFGIALITYLITVERTASYWDCGEFIAVSYKLMVPHPPGAPFFLLLGRMFSFLALGDVTQVAYWINFLSVLSSAFTILFLFWSITLFGRKMMGITKTEQLSEDKIWVLMGAGIVGAFAFTFSDSFWFSAVEAEVYAMSSFFTAFVVWGILKWDLIEDESKANRWLILMFYMMGLSIGVHMLNLVTIPALGLIYYFKKYQPTTWGVVITLIVSGLLIIFIYDFIVPGLPSIAGAFEIFFVNGLSLPFGSGALVFILFLVALLAMGIRYTHKKKMAIWNTFLLSTTFILIGYGSYTACIIRSNHDTPINENAPKDVMSFVKYLKREQYGSRPLLYGPYFTARPIDIKYGAPIYTKGKDKYEATDRKFKYVYEPGEETLLPRAWNADHKESYKSIIGLDEGERPTFSQNIAFMIRHQIGHMYGRYFMWNFAGRESDEQGAGWLWPTDSLEKLPSLLADNKGRNNFFMIPFLLGFLGVFFQFIKDTRNFSVVAMLFIMLGVAVVVYLNSPPEEPRERDYIYAGSFYAFTLWIGLAVVGLADVMNGFIKNLKTSAIITTAVCMSAPVLMAAQGWDDHNRANRLFSVDSAKNYLNSCAPNAVIFTGGDNDTFPLWYAQNVEGVRTDVRVVVLSYYNTDWYIEQSMQKHYESNPLPYTLSLRDYRQNGPNDGLRYENLKIDAIDLKEFLTLLSEGKRLEVQGSNIVPSKILVLDVDKHDVIGRGIIPQGMDSMVVDQMRMRMKGNYLEKKDLAILDVLATSNWERPLYLNFTSMSQINVDLSPYVVQEGNAYRIVPVYNPTPKRELVNTEVSYENMLKKFQYRSLDNQNAYFNTDYRGFVLNHRSSLNALAEALLAEDKKDKAHDVVMFNLEKMPDKGVRYDITSVGIKNGPEVAQGTIEILFHVGEKEKAIEIANTVGDRAIEIVNYYLDKDSGFTGDANKNLYIIRELQYILYKFGESELAKKYEDAYNSIIRNYELEKTNP